MRHPKELCVGTAILLAIISPVVQAQLKLDFCSNQNTGSGSDPQSWTWQSNGWCIDACREEGAALAIVQNKDCWCSDYLPEDEGDTSNCDQPCPGISKEQCGSKDGEYYGYLRLDKKPSGTKSTSKPEPTQRSSTPPSSTPPPPPPPPPKETSREDDAETVIETVTASAPAVTSTSSDKESSETTLKTTTGSRRSSSESIEIFTSSGPGGVSVITKTAYVNFPTDAASDAASESGGSSSSNTGAIVGGVVGGVAGLAALIGGIIFFLWRRRRRQQQESGEVDESGVHRHTSTMSKAGLIRSEKGPSGSPSMIATNIRRQSRMQDSDGGSPGSGHSDRRSSKPYVFDQRLNPSAIMMQDNTSRGSFVSMDDSRDYGRTLNVRNPDPDPDPR